MGEAWRNWYHANREEYLAAQRERQRSPEAKERRRRYLARQRRLASRPARPVVELETIQLKGGLYRIEVYGEGVLIWLWTRHELAEALGISPDTAKRWERIGVLPPPTYISTRRAKLYTLDQVNVTVELFEEMFAGKERIHRHVEEFSQRLHALWDAMPWGIWEDEDV